MSEFRTVLGHTTTKSLVKLNQSIFTLGSCFSDSMGTRLQRHKINTLINPFGTVYNPHSIHALGRYAIENSPVPAHTFLQHQDLFLNYDFHSQFSALRKDDLVSNISNAIDQSNRFLENADVIILTYGTSWVYERKDNHEIVANCHKIPSQNFTKSLLTHKKIIDSFEAFYKALKTFNPQIKIILTVSPVRHTKDTLELNSVSKATLRLACHTLATSFADVDYFPAYEIMMDDLRDYRFYKADLIHPSEVAEDYIWQKFIELYAEDSLKKFLDQWKEILMNLSHKPFHPTSPSHQHFLKSLLKKIEALKPTVNVDVEIEHVKDQIIM